MRTRSRIRLALFAVTIGGALLAAAPAGAATLTPYNTNLVRNPGAEAGVASLDGQSGVPIPHWETLNTFTVVDYGTGGGFPTTTEGTRIHGGSAFFSAGPNTGECDDAIQFILIHGRGSAIDSGHVKVTLRARMGTYDSQTDTANVVLSFHDANNHVLHSANHGDLKLTPVTASGQTLKLRSASKTLPRGTRELRIILSASSVQGYCDAYFDNVSIKLSPI